MLKVNCCSIAQVARVAGIVSAFIASLILPLPVCAEMEPNDTPAQAIQIEAGWQNAVNNAEISVDSDVDFYKFEACGGCSYVIETFNVYSSKKGLWLYDRDGTTPLGDDENGESGSGNSSARIVFTFPVTGTYYLKVADTTYLFDTGVGLYSLRVLAKYDEVGASWDSSNDYEPNDEWLLSTSIDIGREFAETHEIYAVNPNLMKNSKDRDYYHFIAQAGQTYVIEVFDMRSSSKGVWLYDRNGINLLEEDPNGSGGPGGEIGQIVFEAPLSGTYYIKVADSIYLFDTGIGLYSLRVCEDTCLEKIFLPIVLR